MNFEAFLDELRCSPAYADQIVYVHEVPAREARFAEPSPPIAPPIRKMLEASGIRGLYTHQAAALQQVRHRKNVLVFTGTASGKSLCYVIPILEALLKDRDAKALLLFPTKALCQDQFRSFSVCLAGAGLSDVMAGIYDGDTPVDTRRKLRDRACVLFTNPDMLHSAIMPQHGRWADFFARLKLLVIDELHVYTGIFGSNMANLLRRFWRVCHHYGSDPQVIACACTIQNPLELAERLTGKPMVLVDDDGSPRGRRLYVFWNPPRVKAQPYHSRRSANVEAHELMAALITRGVPTITFSKAKMTAEMIYRYVHETLSRCAPHLANSVTPYRGGYLPRERREIERRLFNGEVLGVSATRALELGIDVGCLDASIIVGYPGTLASFFQQAGRAGRQDRDALVVLVGLDTAINQYIMSNPDYLFGRPLERAVLDENNPFVILNHLRCAAQELPLDSSDKQLFGPLSSTVLDVLEENKKVRRISGRWYHAANETPHHEISLRTGSDGNVVIKDADTGQILGEVDRFDAQPILHPDAIYMHQGDTYRVLDLDLDRNVASVQRVDVDYYTDPIGGSYVHHIDHTLREKPFGTGRAFWGEVTVYCRTYAYDKVHFYSLEAISRHSVELPTFVLETMAFWLVPPEELMQDVRVAGLDASAGLRGIGFATKMLLPAFMTCDTLDFSHSVGSANSPWSTLFIYERYPLGLGFTEKAYELLHEIMPAVLSQIANCECEQGCPCCVGKPLRPDATWNVERHEGNIPSKLAAIVILRGLLGNGDNLINPDVSSLTDSAEDARLKLERALRRRLETMREPCWFHPIEPQVRTEYPQPEDVSTLDQADVARRVQHKLQLHRELRRRIAKHVPAEGLSSFAPVSKPPPGTTFCGSSVPPSAFPGRPYCPVTIEAPLGKPKDKSPDSLTEPIRHGDSLAARARRLKKHRSADSDSTRLSSPDAAG